MKEKAPIVSNVLQQLLRVADKANLPLVGGAFSAAAELVTMYNVRDIGPCPAGLISSRL